MRLIVLIVFSLCVMWSVNYPVFAQCISKQGNGTKPRDPRGPQFHEMAIEISRDPEQLAEEKHIARWNALSNDFIKVRKMSIEVSILLDPTATPDRALAARKTQQIVKLTRKTWKRLHSNSGLMHPADSATFTPRGFEVAQAERKRIPQLVAETENTLALMQRSGFLDVKLKVEALQQLQELELVARQFIADLK